MAPDDGDGADATGEPDPFIGTQALAALCDIIQRAGASGMATWCLYRARVPVAHSAVSCTGPLSEEAAATKDRVTNSSLATIQRLLRGRCVGCCPPCRLHHQVAQSDAQHGHSDSEQCMAALRGVVAIAARGSSGLLAITDRPTLLREWLELGESNTIPLRVACLHALARLVEASILHEGRVASARRAASSGDESASGSGEGVGEAKASTDNGGATSSGDAFVSQRVYDALGTSCGSHSTDVLMASLRQVWCRVMFAAPPHVTSAMLARVYVCMYRSPMWSCG